MDEQTVRRYAEAHGAAVVAGDMPHVLADIDPEQHPHMGPVVEALPSPTTAAEVLSVELREQAAVVHIRYSGEATETTIRSVWKQVGGRPLIVEAAPA